MILLLVGWLASVALADTAPPVAAGAVVDRVVAVVNDEVITLSEVYAFHDYIEQTAAQPGGSRLAAEREVVELLMQRLLIAEEISRLHLDVTAQELDRQIDEIARSNNIDREAMRAEIESGGMTWEAYREELAENIREMKFGQYVLRPRITISEDELKDRWRRMNPSTGVEAAHVYAIFLAFPAGADEAAKAAVLARAAEVRSQAAGGADFGALAAANDQAGFGQRGGEMGRFRPGELLPALDAAVVATATGAVSPVVETPQGVFILKVADRGAGDAGYEGARDRIMNELFSERIQAEQETWFEQARRQAVIRVLLGEPGAPPPEPASVAPMELAPAGPAAPEPAPAQPAP